MIGGIQRKDWRDLTASRPLYGCYWPQVLEAASILTIGANSKLIWSEYIHQSNCPSARLACSHNGARLPVAFIVSHQRQPTFPSLTQFILDVGINYKLIWVDHFWRLDRNSWCRVGRTNKFDLKKFCFLLFCQFDRMPFPIVDMVSLPTKLSQTKFNLAIRVDTFFWNFYSPIDTFSENKLKKFNEYDSSNSIYNHWN